MTSEQPSILSSVLTFAGVYLLLALVLNVVLWALETYAGFTMESNAIGVLPFVIGAMQSGQRYGTKMLKKPPASYSWAVGFWFVMVSTVISLAVIYALLSYNGDAPLELLNLALADLERKGISRLVIYAVLGGLLILLWLAARFAFSFGAANGVKLAARLAAKQKL